MNRNSHPQAQNGMIRGVVFDMDGLMFDTEKLAAEAWVATGKQLGLAVSKTLLMETMGRDAEATRQIMSDHFGTGLDYDAWRTLRVDHVEARIDRAGLPVKPGLVKLLEFLKENGYKITVATSTESETACRHIAIAGLTAYFAEVVSGDSVAHGKPAPDIYLRACEGMGLPPDACMALEDSPVGIRSAYRAGMKPVMIPDILQPDPATEKILFGKRDSLLEVIALLEMLSDQAGTTSDHLYGQKRRGNRDNTLQ